MGRYGCVMILDPLMQRHTLIGNHCAIFHYNIRNNLDSLGGNVFFSVLDQPKAYHHLPMEK